VLLVPLLVALALASCALAADWKAENVLVEPAVSLELTAKTMPAPQWSAGVFCRQYTQIGVVSFTVTFQIKGVVELPTNMNPESNPGVVVVLAIFVQGEGKDDCVALWFFDMNWNEIISPGWAATVVGSNVKAELPPTAITWTWPLLAISPVPDPVPVLVSVPVVGAAGAGAAGAGAAGAG